MDQKFGQTAIEIGLSQPGGGCIGIMLISRAILAPNAVALASPAGEKYSLTATQKFPDASGAAVISDTLIDVNVTGLNPNSVYTVWFVDMKAEKAANRSGPGAVYVQNRCQGPWHVLRAFKRVAAWLLADPDDCRASRRRSHEYEKDDRRVRLDG